MAGREQPAARLAIEAVDGKVRITAGAARQATMELAYVEAIRTAFALLGAAQRAVGHGPDDAIGLANFRWRVDADVMEDLAATLIFEHAQAALAFPFDATQLAELAAELVEQCRRIG